LSPRISAAILNIGPLLNFSTKGFESGTSMPRFDPLQLERANSGIAQTILDPNAWPAVMEAISVAAGATGAVLL